MQTPNDISITHGTTYSAAAADAYFAETFATLYNLPASQVDPLAGKVGNPQNAMQGLADMIAAVNANPPRGNEPEPDYPEWYQGVKDALEYVRLFAAYNAGH